MTLRHPFAACVWVAALSALAPACRRARDDERKAAIERDLARAEGPAHSREPAASVPPGDAGAPAVSAPRPAPISAAEAAWVAQLARDIDELGQRSRQLLAVNRLRAASDPRQKSAELIARMQWCDQGSLEACLRAAHVLAFNECLFDRALPLYEKAEALARELPGPAVDSFAVGGTPLRQELALGLRVSRADARQDDQRHALDAICGQIAERDRPLWDEMFARFQAGEVTPAAAPATGEERVTLGAMRKQIVLEVQERVAGLERLNADAARGLHDRLAAATEALCGPEDPLSCATASYLHSSRCRFEEMESAYRRFDTAVSALDPADRALVLDAARDVVGPARAYVTGDAALRERLGQSMCRGG